jgi:hypothetical protein
MHATGQPDQQRRSTEEPVSQPNKPVAPLNHGDRKPSFILSIVPKILGPENSKIAYTVPVVPDGRVRRMAAVARHGIREIPAFNGDFAHWPGLPGVHRIRLGLDRVFDRVVRRLCRQPIPHHAARVPQKGARAHGGAGSSAGAERLNRLDKPRRAAARRDLVAPPAEERGPALSTRRSPWTALHGERHRRAGDHPLLRAPRPECRARGDWDAPHFMTLALSGVGQDGRTAQATQNRPRGRSLRL